MTHPRTVPFTIQTRQALAQLGTPLILATCMWLGTNAQAQPHSHSSGQTLPAATASALPWVDAEVRKVDTATGKVTLKHGPIPNLDMPGMTMVFAVPQAQVLQGLQAGDKVQVTVDKVAGQFTVQALRR